MDLDLTYVYVYYHDKYDDPPYFSKTTLCSFYKKTR